MAARGPAQFRRGMAQMIWGAHGEGSTPAKRVRPARWRLLYALALFAVSLLVVFRAPTNTLWRVAVLATEYGHYLALAAVLALLPGWGRSFSGRLAALLGLLATVIFASSALRAVPVAAELPQQLAAAFGAPPARARVHLGRPAPLVFKELYTGTGVQPVAFQRLVYAERDGQSLHLDLYRPPASFASAPLVVVIHGGAWRSGDSEQLPALNSYLARRGYAVAAITYRLAPRWPFPAALEDVTAAVAFLKARAGQFGIDTTRIVLFGRSAGAHLALLYAYAAGDASVRGVAAFYGPADLIYAWEHPTNPRVLNTPKVLGDFLGGPPASLRQQYEAASPFYHVTPQSPPTLLFHGARDELVTSEQSARLSARLAAAGVPHLFLQLPWATHGCDYNFSGPAGQLSSFAVERFFAAVTAAAPSGN